MLLLLLLVDFNVWCSFILCAFKIAYKFAIVKMQNGFSILFFSAFLFAAVHTEMFFSTKVVCSFTASFPTVGLGAYEHTLLSHFVIVLFWFSRTYIPNGVYSGMWFCVDDCWLGCAIVISVSLHLSLTHSNSNRSPVNFHSMVTETRMKKCFGFR